MTRAAPGPARARPKGKEAPRTGRVAKGRKAESTRGKLLDAAERLFSEHGFHGVTVKDVALEVKVDTALVHYYFGNKAALFDEVLDRRAKILNAERLQSLEDYARAHPDGGTVEGLIDAFVRPLIERTATGGAGWKSYCALVAQVANARSWGGDVMTRYFDPVIRRFLDMLRQVLPDAPDERIYWAYDSLTGAITHTISETGRIDVLSGGACRSSDLWAAYRTMVPYAAAGFAAVCALPPTKAGIS